MKIVVCVKQVPDTTAVKIDPETKSLIRESAGAVVNLFDYHAAEAALQLREQTGGEVIVLSMGPASAESTLREMLAFGADRAILLNDRRFAGSDTWATSYTLACAIRKIGDVDLVLCGRQAVDGDTAQVGPELAAQLGLPQVINVAELSHSGDTLLARRMLDNGYDRCRVKLPAVASVVREINEPRVPTLQGYLRAVSANLTIWTADDLGAQVNRIGLKGSPTRVVHAVPQALRTKATRRLDLSQLDELLEELHYA